jgi:hypothetical protein
MRPGGGKVMELLAAMVLCVVPGWGVSLAGQASPPPEQERHTGRNALSSLWQVCSLLVIFRSSAESGFNRFKLPVIRH